MANVQKSTDSSSLAEVVDRILDKGIVIDAWVLDDDLNWLTQSSTRTSGIDV